MGTRLKIAVPTDYVLTRDGCSYGYFLLAPNLWEPRTRTFTRVLDLAGGAATVRIVQDGDAKARRGAPLTAVADRALARPERTEAKRQIARMLSLDEDAATIAAFHRADPRFRRSGRGRVMRSPTLFEDVIKTVTSCNVTWPSTVNMNRRLCEVAGRASASGLHAFPSARRLARMRPAALRARCSVGYRDQRIVDLARLFVSGEVDPAWLEDPATPDDAVHDAMLELPGIGPYAAANIMQLLGRYSRLPLDTESLRHARTLLGYAGPDRAVMKKLHAHYEPFGAHKFRSYWFELWAFYEGKRGPAWTWERETMAKTFTASQF